MTYFLQRNIVQHAFIVALGVISNINFGGDVRRNVINFLPYSSEYIANT